MKIRKIEVETVSVFVGEVQLLTKRTCKRTNEQVSENVTSSEL